MNTKHFLRVLTAILRLVHPFMPFVSEKLWQVIGIAPGSILEGGFPKADDFPEDPPAEKNLMHIQGLIYEVRNLRGEMNVPPSRNVEIWLRCPDPALRVLADRYRENFLILAKGADLLYLGDAEKPPAASISAVYQGVEIFIPVKGVIQFEEELKRLEKELQKSRKDSQGTEIKLSNEDFLRKAPAEVIQKEKDKVQALKKKIEKLEGHAGRLKELMAQG